MYSERFDRALVFTSQVHRQQRRKGVDVPYINHLMGVASLVGEAGGTEDQVIGALLHDSIEDCIKEYPDIEEQLEVRFGVTVLKIVQGCTDTWTHPKPPWRERKEDYLARLRKKPADDPSVLVSLADKLHNAGSILVDHHEIGDEIFERFRGKKDGTLWYYSELAEIFDEKLPDGRLTKQLRAVVDRLVNL